MTREVEEDDFLFTSLLAFQCLTDGSGNSMTALRSRDDAFRASEGHTSLEGLELWDVHTMHETVFDELADNHAGTMVAETTCMDVRGAEVMTEGVHG